MTARRRWLTPTARGRPACGGAPTGASWQATALPLTLGGAGTFDPFAPSTLYAGEGGKYQRSTDGGRTWAAMAPFAAGDSPFAFFTDPSAPDVIHAPGWYGMRRSHDGGHSWGQEDNGLPTPSVGDGLQRFTLAPSAPSRLYSIGEQGVFRSDDTGASWRAVGAPFMAVELFPIELDRDTVYALVTGGLAKTSDGGTSWRMIPPPARLPPSDSWSYLTRLMFSRSAPGTLLLSGARVDPGFGALPVAHRRRELTASERHEPSRVGLARVPGALRIRAMTRFDNSVLPSFGLPGSRTREDAP